MENQNALNKISDDRELIVRIVLSSWKGHKNRVNGLLEKLTDEQLASYVTTSKNTGIYIFGHMISISDMLLPNLGFGEITYPELKETYFTNAEQPEPKAIDTIENLKEKWENINEKLNAIFNNRKIDEWFEKYPNISDEDFFKNPLKTKLELLIFKINHLYYHTGQLTLLNKQNSK